MATRKQVVLSQGGAKPIYEYYGKDGRRYDTWEAAVASDKAYDAQMSGGKSSGNYARDVYNASKKSTSAGSGGSSSNMTNEFLSKWGEMNKQALDTLTKTLEGAFSGDSQASSVFGDLIGNIQNQISYFDENYGGYAKQALDTTIQDLETRRGLITNLTDMARPDYAGVSGRAAADVAAQHELAREDMALNAMSYGVDPTSGKFGELSKKSFLAEARDKVEAMNKARMGEKNRSAGLTAEALQAINPAISASIASDLMNQKSNLLGLQTNVAGALTNAEKAKADTAIAVANAVGDIGSQYGSAGLTMLGINEGKTGAEAGSTYTPYNDIYGGRVYQTGGINTNPAPSINSNPAVDAIYGKSEEVRQKNLAKQLATRT